MGCVRQAVGGRVPPPRSPSAGGGGLFLVIGTALLTTIRQARMNSAYVYPANTVDGGIWLRSTAGRAEDQRSSNNVAVHLCRSGAGIEIGLAGPVENEISIKNTSGGEVTFGPGIAAAGVDLVADAAVMLHQADKTAVGRGKVQQDVIGPNARFSTGTSVLPFIMLGVGSTHGAYFGFEWELGGRSIGNTLPSARASKDRFSGGECVPHPTHGRWHPLGRSAILQSRSGPGFGFSLQTFRQGRRRGFQGDHTQGTGPEGKLCADVPGSCQPQLLADWRATHGGRHHHLRNDRRPGFGDHLDRRTGKQIALSFRVMVRLLLSWELPVLAGPGTSDRAKRYYFFGETAPKSRT